MRTIYMKELVRTAFYREKKSKSQIAKQLGMSRKTVRKLLALGPDEVPQYRLMKAKRSPVMEPFKGVITQWLEADEKAPVKQRHTAQRIYERLKAEYGFQGSDRTVREYVSKIRKPLEEVFLPLGFQAGEMGQVDWGEFQAIIAGVQKKLYLFGLVLNYSGAHYVEAYERQNQESFFQAHQNAFFFLEGVPKTLTYDNLTSAVTKILKGRNRIENERFVTFRSGYLFESRFCNPARGNEKGRIENMVKYAQRNYFTPVPAFESLEALNHFLREKCIAYQEKRQVRQRETVGERLTLDRAHLLRLPTHIPQCCRILPVKVDKSALVQFETNRYSVPSEYAYKTLWLKSFVDHIEVTYEDKLIASHPRLLGKFQERIQLEHYRKVLERKPGAAQHIRATEGAPIFSEQAAQKKPARKYPTIYVQPPNVEQYGLLLKEFQR